MQPHDQNGERPRKPTPQEKRTKWLLLAIAVLLGLLVTQLLWRYF
jgi:hypothetical protein